jgi:hypothetical protein
MVDTPRGASENPLPHPSQPQSARDVSCFLLSSHEREREARQSSTGGGGLAPTIGPRTHATESLACNPLRLDPLVLNYSESFVPPSSRRPAHRRRCCRFLGRLVTFPRCQEPAQTPTSRNRLQAVGFTTHNRAGNDPPPPRSPTTLRDKPTALRRTDLSFFPPSSPTEAVELLLPYRAMNGLSIRIAP